MSDQATTTNSWPFKRSFTPEAAVSWREGASIVLDHDTFNAELAGVLQDEFAVACVVAVELKAGLVATKGSSSALRSMSGRLETSRPSRCKMSDL